MSRLQFDSGPYDLFVCDFLYVPSYVASGYGACVYIVYEHRVISSTGFRRRSGYVRRLRGNRAVSAASARARAAYIWRPRRDGKVPMRSPCSLPFVYQNGSTSHVIYLECYGANA